MNNEVKKPYWKLVVAAIFAIVGFAFFAWISAPGVDFSDITASQIRESEDVVINDFYLLGKLGSKEISNVEYSYYIILAQDKANTRFTMAMRVDKDTAAEFEKIASSSETAQTITEKFYGNITAMEQTTAESYDALLEKYGYSESYPNLYYVFNDTQGSSGTSGGLGLIFLIPFLAFATFFVISFIKSVNVKES